MNKVYSHLVVTDTHQMISEIIKEKRFVDSVIDHILGR